MFRSSLVFSYINGVTNLVNSNTTGVLQYHLAGASTNLFIM